MDPALVTHPATSGMPLLLFGIFEQRIDAPLSIDNEHPHVGEPTAPGKPSIPRAQYDSAIADILRYIAAGDSYQVNFTFRLRGRYEGSPEALYRSICQAQRSEFCASIRFEDRMILSASPELFFHQEGRRIRMRPMKGTRPRGRWPEEDEALGRELAGSAKDRAENLMIVDLLRNDLGRIASFGSVRVPRLFDIERYPTVFQMTSSVEAELAEGVTLPDLFRALFPCGSVTGAPKIRTMEIIRELEEGARGVYTGSIGIVSPGESIFSVAIRTVVLDLTTGDYELGVGSGITADSVAATEYDECLSKGSFLHTRNGEFELLESLRLEVPGGYRRHDAHLNRLSDSARYFGFEFVRQKAEDELERVAAGLEAGMYKVRLLLSRDGSVTGGAERIPSSLPPARLGLAAASVSSENRLLYHKTTWREPYRRALEECPDYDDVILRNERDELTETCVGNLVLELDQKLVTPPLESGLLGGVMRAELLRNGVISERVLTARDLTLATRVFVINSVREWRAAYFEARDATQ